MELVEVGHRVQTVSHVVYRRLEQITPINPLGTRSSSDQGRGIASPPPRGWGGVRGGVRRGPGRSSVSCYGAKYGIPLMDAPNSWNGR